VDSISAEQNAGKKKLSNGRRGIINPVMLRIAAFAIIVISTIFSVTLSILAIWDFTNSDAIWRAIATFLVVILGTVVVVVANEVLATREY
jgi:hypothetical protein